MPFPEILQRDVEPVSYLVTHDATDVDVAGLRNLFQARRNIDAVAEDVVLLGDHITEIDADPKRNAPLVWDISLALRHPALDLYSAAYGIHNAREFHEHAVARILDNAAPVLPDLR